MPFDLRDRNTYFSRESISSYLLEYAAFLKDCLFAVDSLQIDLARELLNKTHKTGGRVFVGGNGGSAAISDHLNCDFIKGTHTEKTTSINVQSLVGSQALFTAIGNDFGYEHTFSFQLKAANLTSQDMVILISSSGNSPNIVEAARFAHDRRSPVLGLTGFDGGALKEIADVKIHIPFNNYGIVEDCHQAIMHILAQWHYLSSNG